MDRYGETSWRGRTGAISPGEMPDYHARIDGFSVFQYVKIALTVRVFAKSGVFPAFYVIPLNGTLRNQQGEQSSIIGWLRWWSGGWGEFWARGGSVRAAGGSLLPRSLPFSLVCPLIALPIPYITVPTLLPFTLAVTPVSLSRSTTRLNLALPVLESATPPMSF